MIESPLLKHVQGYINGRWAGADSGETMPVYNPATGEKLADVPAMGPQETTAAIEAAQEALKTPASLEQRKQWLQAIIDLHFEHKEELGRILTLEHGKPHKEAVVEVEYAAAFYRNCLEHADVLRSVTIDERPKNCAWTVHRRPAGVAALITPWNFPIGLFAKKFSAALVADCATVVKPASMTPLTLIAFFHLLEEKVGLPPGKANLVMGKASPIGETICTHPAVRAISFTGSTEVGKTLMKSAAGQVKRLTLELGGNAPFIVFEDADLDAAADNLMANKFRGSGQTCVCTNRVYVHRVIADAFSEKVVARVNELKLGDGMAPDTDIGPLINKDGWDKVKRHTLDAVQKGARVVAGKEDPGEPKDEHWGAFYPPTVLRGVTEVMACAREETFGPLVAILEFEDEDDVIRRANGTEFGLAGYFFTNDQKRGERVARQLRFGHVGWNTGTGPTPEAPFGGMKESGYGREGGIEGVMEFVETQTVPKPL